mgnify:CR=1 FL=1
MKKLFTFIQNNGVAFAVLFALLPQFVLVSIATWGAVAFWFTLSLTLITSFVMSGCFLWYLTAGFQLKHRGYFTAVGFSALFALLQGVAMLLVVNTLIEDETYKNLTLLSFTLLLGVLWGFTAEWFIKPLKGEVGGE